MMLHPTLDKLTTLRLPGMKSAFSDQLQLPEMEALNFDDRFGLIVDREATYRDNKKLQLRLRNSKLRHNAAIEDIDYQHPRQLDKTLMLTLTTSQWIAQHHNVFITGKTGLGKSWLGCALAQKACRDGYSARYTSSQKLFRELTLGRADGRYGKILREFAKVDCLVIDDFGIAPLTEENQRDLLEILEDRYGVHSTLLTSQYKQDNWHGLMSNPTLADAIMDRLVHNAYKLNLDGESMRKPQQKLTATKALKS
jgi:DNA replication protein DnaC